jgi:hypothetical protein
MLGEVTHVEQRALMNAAEDAHIGKVYMMEDEIHRRQPDGHWITYYFNQDADEEVEFQSVELTMTLGEIYRRVKFEK